MELRSRRVSALTGQNVDKLLPPEMVTAILKRCPLMDCIRVERVCRTWQHISRKSWKPFTGLGVNSGSLEVWTAKQQFSRSDKVTKIDCKVTFPVVAAIFERCGPLKDFKIGDSLFNQLQVDIRLIQLIIRHSGLTIEHMHLTGATFIIASAAEIPYFEKFLSLPTLRSLHLGENCISKNPLFLPVVVNALHNTKRMEELSLEWNYSGIICLERMTSMFRVLGPNLTKLRLSFCYKPNDLSPATALSLLTNMEEVDVGNFWPLNSYPHITATGTASVLSDKDAILLAKSWPRLRFINLQRAIKLTHHGVRAFLEQCPRLISINLTECLGVGSQLLTAAVASSNPVTIIADETVLISPSTPPPKIHLIFKNLS